MQDYVRQQLSDKKITIQKKNFDEKERNQKFTRAASLLEKRLI